MAHLTKDKGDLAVAKAMAHLLGHGIRVCMPLSEHLPFDFIAVMPDMTTLKRVQVKYRALEKGYVPFSFRSNYYNSKRIYTVRVDLNHIDAYATFCPETDAVYYLRVNEIPANSTGINMRVAPPRNGQKKGIWLAENYLDPYRISAAKTYDNAPSFAIERFVNNDLAVAQVEVDMLQHGWYTCSPFRWNAPFDLIAVSPDMMRLTRVRVGQNRADSTPYADAYALYNPVDGTVRYINAAHVRPEDRCVGADTHASLSQPLATAFAG